jgi:hypothetical protein
MGYQVMVLFNTHTILSTKTIWSTFQIPNTGENIEIIKWRTQSSINSKQTPLVMPNSTQDLVPDQNSTLEALMSRIIMSWRDLGSLGTRI